MLRLQILPDLHCGFYWLILRDRPDALPEEVEESKTAYRNRLRCEHAGEKRLAELQKQ